MWVVENFLQAGLLEISICLLHVNLIYGLYEISYKPVCRKFLSWVVENFLPN